MRFIFLNILLLVLVLGHFNPVPTQKHTASGTAISGGQQANLEAHVIARELEVPWEIAWGPDNQIWTAEQRGVVSRINPETGVKAVLLNIPDVWHLRTAGLLGMALHPDMKKYPYVFLNYTFLRDKKPFSRLVRYTFKSDKLTSPEVLLEIAAANGHSGSRLAFYQGKLFWATGDAGSTTFAQDPDSPNGKILRLNIDGSVPKDNPVKGSPVWAMGFRNIQGMTFSPGGKLYTSEHGDATDDELNLIEKTRNYGWPAVQGFAEDAAEQKFKAEKSTVDPLRSWTPTVAPAGIDHYASKTIPQWSNSLLMVTLKGKSLRSLKLSDDGKRIIDEEIFLENQYGRLRDICISPTGDVYISTSNRDWNRTMGDPAPADDRIIRIRPAKGSSSLITSAAVAPKATLYQQYCASCHREDGTGLASVFPPLKGSSLVIGEELALLGKILKGSSGPATINGVKYEAQMPSFAFLNDAQVAEIAGFIRRMNALDNWAVRPEAVERARLK